MDKQMLRTEILSRRGRLSETELAHLSEGLLNQLIASGLLEPAETVMLYMDFRDEARTSGIIEYLWKTGKNVVVPKVNKKADKLDLYSISTFGDLARSSFGILEPPKDRVPDVDPQQLDLILSPGVVFDSQGNRIGYGAGYYDKLLPSTRTDCLVCGLAFELQIVDPGLIPVEPHDVPLDFIVTEARFIKTRSTKK
ncbi:MAG: 5-formyltetrahydrofolate cyclo-ligase [Erysipelotrichaceae bacterium]|nr:5-formyltetrahydrofolate cyclo-ligase [Erysipelotrichaceae bacterium]